MSNSITSSVQTDGESASVPRAVIHKKILDAAAARPDASMEAIADEVSGATISIVEQVLEEYGDPATDSEPTESDDDEPADESGRGDECEADRDVDTEDRAGDPDPAERETHAEPGERDDRFESDDDTAGDSSADDSDPEDGASPDDDHERNDHGRRSEPPLEPGDVTEKQLETLEEIARRPEATQAELADTLGVTSATINQRVNAIDGFDWSERREFVAALLDGDASSDGGRPAAVDGSAADVPRADGANGDERVDGVDADGRTDDPVDADGNLEREPSTPPGPTEPGNGRADGTQSSNETTRPLRTDAPRNRANGPTSQEAPTVSDDSIDALETRLDRIARKLEAFEGRVPGDPSPRWHSPFEPELLHKVLHACLTAEHISEEEELRILKAVTGDATEPT